MKNINKDRIYKFATFFLYVTISFFLVIIHESWEDEAQAWLISRDLNIIDIIGLMKYEGHSAKGWRTVFKLAGRAAVSR